MEQGSGVLLYVGTHDGVLALTSRDGGRTWSQGPVTQLEHAAAKIAASRTKPERAYLAAYESGIYRTDDGGGSWRHLDRYPTEHAHSVVVHPDDPDTIYVGSEPAMVFRTHDGGETWEACEGIARVPESSTWSFHAEGRHAHVRDLALAPDHPDWLYAGIEVGGLVRSKDAGATWEALAGTDPDVHTLTFAAAQPGTMYAGTGRGPFRSRDCGESWEPIGEGLDKRYTLPILAAPDDAERVLLGVADSARRKAAQAWLSLDAGQTWGEPSGLGAPDDMVVAYVWDPTNPARVYAGSDYGRIYVSHDQGTRWEQADVRLPRVAVGAMAASPLPVDWPSRSAPAPGPKSH